MVEQILKYLAVLFLSIGLASAGTNDPTTDIYIPNVGEVGYGGEVNLNFNPRISENLPVERYTCPGGTVNGDFVYVSGTDTISLSRADAAATAKIDGVVYQVFGGGTSCRIRSVGKVLAGLSGMTAPAEQYLSATAAGKTTDSKPVFPNIAVFLGRAKNATTLALPSTMIKDLASVGGNLQDAYDQGPAAAIIQLNGSGSLEVQDSGASPIWKVDEATATVLMNLISAFPGNDLTLQAGGAGLTVLTTSGAIQVDVGVEADVDGGAFVGGPTTRMSTFRYFPSSSPPSTSSTPSGETWFTDASPSGGFQAFTIHVWDGTEWGPVGKAGGASFSVDSFTPTTGQTNFALSDTPAQPNGLIVVTLNTAVAEEGVSYTLSGSTLTWLNVPAALDPSDTLVVYYQIASVATPEQYIQDVFTSGVGQTNFTLSQSFIGIAGFNAMFINGITYPEGTSYTISGTALTWLDNPFVLLTGMQVIVKYQR